MMLDVSAQEWFLEVNGKKTGPFTSEHVLGLFREKEIPETQRVTCNALSGKWIMVRELISLQTTQHVSVKGAFPNRPAEAPLSDTPPVVEDPALALFDALQASKERKPARPVPPLDSVSSHPKETQNVPAKKAWVLGAVVAGLLVAIWAMVSLIKEKTPSEKPVVTEAPKSPPPVKAAVVPPPPAANAQLRAGPTQHSLGNSSNTMPPALNESREREEREREYERDRERERERERERTNESSAALPPTLPEPPAQPMDPGITNNEPPPAAYP